MTRTAEDGPEARALTAAHAALSPLALHTLRPAGALVGRPVEVNAIEQELASAAAGRLTGATLEGEPGIGKTRLLLATGEMATARGFTTIAVTGDEELRGPFLVARSIVGSIEAMDAARGTSAEETLVRCMDAMTGQDDPGLASLPPDRKLLRTLDLGAVAIRDLAAIGPVALLVDDLQWADDDSLRLLRYIVRADGASPIFLLFAIRPEEFAFATEAVNLVADMERVGLVRRLRLDRFSKPETKALLQQLLGGTVSAPSAAAMHAQSEGVPFIVEEMAHAYRDGGMIQQIDGVWTLAGNAERLLPSAVRTLISRRAAHLPEDAKAALAEAAVLGRHFSLKDLREVRLRVDEQQASPEELAASLAPAVAAGLLVEHDERSAADYSFPHDQIREFASAGLSAPRRRAIHSAIVELLLVGEPSPASLPLLAQHAKAAGDAEVCVKFSLEASRMALDANAPEEVLRVVEVALPSAAGPTERVKLLEARDRALEMLRRPEDRMQGLAELSALAGALGDTRLELDVRLRRAASLRMQEEEERAAVLAREVRELAASDSDGATELGACLELGQDLLKSPLGEGYIPAAREVDFDGAEEAYSRAGELANELGDDASLAAALREQGVIQLGRVREWFVERILANEHLPVVQRIAAGESIEAILPELPIAPAAEAAARNFEAALELYERLGDRRGAMSTIIAMGYLSWAADIHLGSNAARHIEEIRRLTFAMRAFTNESERVAFEAQMLYGVHVFARAKVIPDLAVSRGGQAFAKAQEIGDRSLEFLAAGGTALALFDLGAVEEGRAWLDRAAATALESPTPLRARRLETWRGLAFASAGDAEQMRRHL
ncbi:MAG: AAA family ATPase, partial [Actinomycetota bacterium]